MKKLPQEFEQLNNLLQETEQVLIYGANRIAKDTLEVLRYHGQGKKVSGFVVTSMSGNPNRIDEFSVGELLKYEKYDRNTTLVIVAMPEKFFEEVTKHLKAYYFENVYYVGSRQLSLWENNIVIQTIQKKLPMLQVTQDELEQLCIRLTIAQHTYRLMPLGTFPFGEDYIDTLSHMEQMWNLCGNPIELSECVSQTSEKQLECIKIYAASSPKDSPVSYNRPFENWEQPVVGGAALAEISTEAKRDDVGKNISEKNRQYAEMTVAYWAWQNSKSEYIGLEHYRRRYELSEEQLTYAVQTGIDVILTRPRIVLPSVKEWFPKVSSLSAQDMEEICKWLKDKMTEAATEVDGFFQGNILYPNNMVIAQKEVYRTYCEWLFTLLEEIDQNKQFEKLRLKSRYDAYLAELLTSFYFILNRDKYQMAIADYRLLA